MSHQFKVLYFTLNDMSNLKKYLDTSDVQVHANHLGPVDWPAGKAGFTGSGKPAKKQALK